ncbi:hypothetical protein HOY82DRAFT_669290 [Tuber indicum]|nr:hypothetical protein HOY82DRAFT_669290 [Tuber indicum]
MDLTPAILRAAGICSRTGQNLLKRYQTTQGTSRYLDRLNLLVENVLIDIASRLATVQRSPEAVPGNLRVGMEKLLHRLLCFLHTSYKNLENATENDRRTVMKKMKFSLFQRRLLEKDVSALRGWRDEFDSSFPTLSTPQVPEPESFQ